MHICRRAEIRKAIAEADDFIGKAMKLLEIMDSKEAHGDFLCYSGGPENAAMKRASLDLSKALVAVRKPL